MKCDELQYERLGDANKTYPESTLVIRKQFVDGAIDELKREHHRERHEYIDMVAQLKAENQRLKKKMDDYHLMSDIRRAKIKGLKRALWLARANDASSFAGLFSTLSYIEDDETRTYWIFGNKRKIVFDGLKCSRMETAYKWFCIWDGVANKCLKKAEECK